METYDVLDAHLVVVHVHDEFHTTYGSHRICPALIYILASE
jgi:hypothetical protein